MFGVFGPLILYHFVSYGDPFFNLRNDIGVKAQKHQTQSRKTHHLSKNKKSQVAKRTNFQQSKISRF